MNYKELKQKIKTEQKQLAWEIKVAKPLRKPSNYEKADGLERGLLNDLEWNRDEFRHRHIIYCNMFNNTPYDLIERPREGNKPSSHKLDRIKKEWESMLDEETVRNSS